MLDDLPVITQRDSQDALGVAGAQWEYFSRGFDAVFTKTNEIHNIVWAGMGGSALPAVIIEQWPRPKVPFEIVRDYDIPAYVNQHTLFIASSYSGNTEETLAALEAAHQRGSQIAVIASGGKLGQLAQEHGYPLFVIPAGIQPRMATFYFVNAFAAIVKDLDIVSDSLDELYTLGEWLRSCTDAWAKDILLADNLAKQLATQLVGKTVIMYAGPKLFPAANKWKIGCNENAKNTAWANYFPELNHNEFIGWTSHPIEKPFAVVELRSGLEHQRTQSRFEITEKLLSGQRPAPIVVTPQGDTLLKQLSWSFAFGDFVTIYLGLLNNVDPTPVALVEKLKVALHAV